MLLSGLQGSFASHNGHFGLLAYGHDVLAKVASSLDLPALATAVAEILSSWRQELRISQTRMLFLYVAEFFQTLGEIGFSCVPLAQFYFWAWCAKQGQTDACFGFIHAIGIDDAMRC